MSQQTSDNTSGSIRIIILSDHPIVREGLRVLLSREAGFDVCSDVEATPDALMSIGIEAPHLVIVDVSLELGRGLKLIRGIKELRPSFVILASSMSNDRLYPERALAAGAMGYIDNRAGIDRIVEAIHGVMTRGN